ncbi:hypothetical protein KSP40_PGU010176 [Platanthera guangdongensis]|uniref:Uncharacterized protein n=1 Tax=Platanthera guangdongensis TaxID=2320717 RepID=A0ABR2MMN6_9ASPA
MEQIQKKMSLRFARSFSFPVPSAAGSQFLAIKSRSAVAAALFAGKHASYKHRSVSLPARLHPIVAQIEEQIRSLQSWHHSAISSSVAGSPEWIVDGLAGIEDLHSSLTALLHHPQSHEALSVRRSLWADRLLEDSLRFADAHSAFRSSILALSDLLSAARSALRRRDEAALCSALRAQKKVEKQLLKLAASARGIGRSGPAEPVQPEVGSVAREATTVTAVASAAVFAGMAMLASAAMAGASKGTNQASVVGALVWRSAAFKRRMEVEDEGWRERAMKRMEAVEKCISELEICSQRVLRGMLNTRVFLLNAQTPLM